MCIFIHRARQQFFSSVYFCKKKKASEFQRKLSYLSLDCTLLNKNNTEWKMGKKNKNTTFLCCYFKITPKSMNAQNENIYIENAKMSIVHYLQNICSNPATNHQKILWYMRKAINIRTFWREITHIKAH